jgi:hypothetical protein
MSPTVRAGDKYRDPQGTRFPPKRVLKVVGVRTLRDGTELVDFTIGSLNWSMPLALFAGMLERVPTREEHLSSADETQLDLVP